MNKEKTVTVTKKKTVKTPKKKADEVNPLEEVINLIKKYTFEDVISLIDKTDFDENQLKQINDNIDNFDKIKKTIKNKLDKLEAQKEKEAEEIENQMKKDAEKNYYEEINELIKTYIDEIEDKKLKTFLKPFKMISCDEKYEEEQKESDGEYNETDIIFNGYHLDFNLINKKGIEIQFEKEYKEITNDTYTMHQDYEDYTGVHKHNVTKDTNDENYTNIIINTPDKKYENLKEFCDDYKLNKDNFKNFIIFISDEIFVENHGYDFDYDF